MISRRGRGGGLARRGVYLRGNARFETKKGISLSLSLASLYSYLNERFLFFDENSPVVRAKRENGSEEDSTGSYTYPLITRERSVPGGNSPPSQILST